MIKKYLKHEKELMLRLFYVYFRYINIALLFSYIIIQRLKIISNNLVPKVQTFFLIETQ